MFFLEIKEMDGDEKMKVKGMGLIIEVKHWMGGD